MLCLYLPIFLWVLGLTLLQTLEVGLRSLQQILLDSIVILTLDTLRLRLVSTGILETIHLFSQLIDLSLSLCDLTVQGLGLLLKGVHRQARSTHFSSRLIDLLRRILGDYGLVDPLIVGRCHRSNKECSWMGRAHLTWHPPHHYSTPSNGLRATPVQLMPASQVIGQPPPSG